MSAALSEETGVELKAADVSALSAVVSNMEKELAKAAPSMSPEELEKAKAALASIDLSALTEASLSGEPVHLTPELAASLQEALAVVEEATGVVAEAEAGDVSGDSRRVSLPSVTALKAMSSVLEHAEADKDTPLTAVECVALKESLDSVSGLLSDETLAESLTAADRASLERANAKLRAGASSKRGAQLTPEEMRAVALARDLVAPKIAEQHEQAMELEESSQELRQLLAESVAEAGAGSGEPVILSSSEVGRLKDVIGHNEDALASLVMSDPSNEALQSALRKVAGSDAAGGVLALSSSEVASLAAALEAEKASLEAGPEKREEEQRMAGAGSAEGGEAESLELSPLFELTGVFEAVRAGEPGACVDPTDERQAKALDETAALIAKAASQGAVSADEAQALLASVEKLRSGEASLTASEAGELKDALEKVGLELSMAAAEKEAERAVASVEEAPAVPKMTATDVEESCNVLSRVLSGLDADEGASSTLQSVDSNLVDRCLHNLSPFLGELSAMDTSVFSENDQAELNEIVRKVAEANASPGATVELTPEERDVLKRATALIPACVRAGPGQGGIERRRGCDANRQLS
jgi:hypothetical protein